MKKLLVISIVLAGLACSQRTTPAPVISDENVIVNPPVEVVPVVDEDVAVTEEEATDEVLPTCDEDATPVLPTEDATPTSDETTD